MKFLLLISLKKKSRNNKKAALRTTLRSHVTPSFSMGFINSKHTNKFKVFYKSSKLSKKNAALCYQHTHTLFPYCTYMWKNQLCLGNITIVVFTISWKRKTTANWIRTKENNNIRFSKKKKKKQARITTEYN